MGFVPQVVDLNGDGLSDIVSGSYMGDNSNRTDVLKDENGKQISEVFVYYGKKDGGFAPKVRIATCHVHALVTAADWDSDGDFDLITADRSAQGICYMENIGSKTDPKFADYVPLIPDLPEKDAKQLMITSAVAFDWDGDGMLDLLAGNEWGAILYFRNKGTAEIPAFDPVPVVLAGKSTVRKTFQERRDILRSMPWGSRLALHVLDWDGDGVADLLVGDNKSVTLTKEQRFAGASEDDLKRFAEAEAKMKELQGKSREMSKEIDFKAMSDDEKVAFQKKMKTLFDSYKPYQDVVNEEFPERKMHGHVWVFKGIKE